MSLALQQAFGVSDQVVFVSDSNRALGWFRSQALGAASLQDALTRPPPSMVLVPVDYRGWVGLSPRRQFGKTFGASKVLWVPLAGFDASAVGLAYTIERLLRSDIEDSVRYNKDWVDSLERFDGPIRFVGPGSDFVFEPTEEIEAASRLEAAIRPGEWVAVGDYFEVEFESVASEAPPLGLNGTLTIDGIDAVRAFAMPAVLYDLHREAQTFANQAARAGEPIRVMIQDNRMVSCKIGRLDVTGTVRRFTNDIYDMQIVEFSIGSNALPDSIDWGVNSVMNEGLRGLHIAVGDGLTGVHMDFVCTRIDDVSIGHDETP